MIRPVKEYCPKSIVPMKKRLITGPLPSPILNVNGEVIGIIEKENLPYVVPKPRPLPKPPRIHGNDKSEGIRDPEKEHLLGTEPNYRPPPKPPQKFLT